MSLAALLELFGRCRIYDLAHPLEEHIPVSPNQPGFLMSLKRRHGDRVRADGGSAANELLVLGGHTGTHIDALCHVSHEGKLHGGIDAADAQRGGRFGALGVETILPTFCRGVMLDLAALRGVDALAPGEAVSAGDLEAACARQGTRVLPGDVVLLRTGWDARWGDPERFIGAVDGAPGPDVSAARWLVERGARMAGAETVAFEHIPPGRGHALLPVHRILLVEAGIFILEAMRLGDLARDRVHEFAFVLAPLRIVGATGVPVRPLALHPAPEDA